MEYQILNDIKIVQLFSVTYFYMTIFALGPVFIYLSNKICCDALLLNLLRLSVHHMSFEEDLQILSRLKFGTHFIVPGVTFFLVPYEYHSSQTISVNGPIFLRCCTLAFVILKECTFLYLASIAICNLKNFS